MAKFESFSVVEHTTSVTSATVAKPAGTVAGDLLIVTGLWGSTGATDVPILPAGFTSRSSAGNLALRYNIGWKIAGEAEPADYTVTINGAYQCLVSVLRISGWNTADPIPDLVHVTGSSMTPLSPAITPTVDGLLLHIHMGGGFLYTNVVEDSGYPAGDTGLFLRAAIVGNPVANRGQGISYRAATAGVAVPDVTWDTGASSNATYRGISFVVASSPGGGTGQTINLGSVSETDAPGAIEVQGGEPIPVPVAPPPIESDHAIARDLTTGFDLYLKAPDTQFSFVASTAKLLTSVVLMDHKAGVLATETVTVEAADLVGGTMAGLQAGDVLTWEDLLYCVYLPSGNDACETLARVLGDWLFAEGLTSVAGRDGFMEAMNAKAAALGMASSSFESPHGVLINPEGTDDDVNITTARDMALAIEVAYMDPVIRDIAGAVNWNVTIIGPNARTLPLTSLVKLINGPYNAPAGIRDEGILAGKTGGTADGIYSLATLWQAPNGHHIAIGIWGANTDGHRYLDTRAIMYGLLRDFPDLDVPPVSDPDFDKVVFLAGFESGIVDESSYARTLTNVGAALTATSPLIGSQSIETFGGTTRVETADAPELSFGADDFAIELFFRGSGTVPTDHAVLISHYDVVSQREWSLQYDVSNRQLIFWTSTDGANFTAATFKFDDFNIAPEVFFNGAPRHIMPRRSGAEIALYMNGEKGGGVNNIGVAALHNSTAKMMIGARMNGASIQYPLAGVFDEIRITKGAPRQTAVKYTAYGRAFPRTAVAETVIDIAAVTETAAAVGIAAAKTIMLGAVSESENAVAPVIAKSAPLAAVANADAPGLVTGAKTAALPPVAATEAVGSVSASITAQLAAVSEDDQAGILSAETVAALAAVTETDHAGAIQVGTEVVLTLPPVTETDQTGALTITTAVMLGAVADTSAAGDIAAHKTAAVAAASETDVLGGLSAMTTVALGAVGETDLGAALLVGVLLDLPPVVETDHAGMLQVGTNVVLTLPPVTELDQTGALGIAKAATLGSVTEAAQARPAEIDKAAALGSAAEADQLGDLITSKAVTVTAVGEASLSAPATVAKTVLLEWVTEIDLAGEVSGTPIALRVVSVSIVPALSGTVSIGPATSGQTSIN